MASANTQRGFGIVRGDRDGIVEIGFSNDEARPSGEGAGFPSDDMRTTDMPVHGMSKSTGPCCVSKASLAWE